MSLQCVFLADIRQSVIVILFFNVKSAELFGYQTLNKFIIIIYYYYYYLT